MSLFTLKNTLIIDAITCTGLFVFCVFATATVATLLGLPSEVVTVAGWIGLPSALLMLFVANQKVPNKGLANLIAVGNLGWVIASFAVLAMFAGQMTALGIAVVIVQAIGVLVFRDLRSQGRGRLCRARSPSNSAHRAGRGRSRPARSSPDRAAFRRPVR